jgi:hypothetical protein
MTPNPQLLQRDLARAFAEANVGDVQHATRDMVDEGTQLLARLLAEAARFNPRRHLHSALLLLLRHCIEQADAVDELMREGIFTPAALQVRSIIEAYMQMLYMTARRVEFAPSPLGANHVDPVPMDPSTNLPVTGFALDAVKERRGAAYIVADVRKTRDFTHGLSTTQVTKWMLRATGSDAVPDMITDPAKQAGLAEELARHDATLASAEFCEINTAITAARGSRSYDLPWYAIDGGPTSARALSASVGAISLYDLFYTPASEVMHAQNIRRQLGDARDTGGHGPAPLRSAHTLGSGVVWKLFIAMAQVYRVAIQELRPSDMELWNQWAQRWFAVVAEEE